MDQRSDGRLPAELADGGQITVPAMLGGSEPDCDNGIEDKWWNAQTLTVGCHKQLICPIGCLFGFCLPLVCWCVCLSFTAWAVSSMSFILGVCWETSEPGAHQQASWDQHVM